MPVLPLADEVVVEPEPARRSLSRRRRPAEFTIEPEDTVSMVIVDSPLADELAEIGQDAGGPRRPDVPEVEPVGGASSPDRPG